jgi:hypothetical protein
MASGNNQHVAWIYRLNVHERPAYVVLKHDARGELPSQDVTKHAGMHKLFSLLVTTLIISDLLYEAPEDD